jgi:probable rRNA maturation factor
MPKKFIPIYFHYLTSPLYLPQRYTIKKFLLSVFEHHSKSVENLNYIFCTDNYLLNLNKNYLNHNYYTDIITFELNQPIQPIQADIYISVERARDNAKSYNVPIIHEIMRLIIHGALHLCGYKDKSEEEFKKMKSLEELHLSRWFHVKRKKEL